MNTFWADYAEMLIYYQPFRNAVARFQNKYSVPVEVERAEWFRGLMEESLANGKKRISPFSDQLPWNSRFFKDLLKLGRRFRLDDRWAGSLFFFVCGDKDKLDTPPINGSIIVKINDARLPESKRTVEELALRFYKDTTLDDLRELLRQAEKYQKMMQVDLPRKRTARSKANKTKYIRLRQLQDEGTLGHDELMREAGIETHKSVNHFKDRIEEIFKPEKKPGKK